MVKNYKNLWAARSAKSERERVRGLDSAPLCPYTGREDFLQRSAL